MPLPLPRPLPLHPSACRCESSPTNPHARMRIHLTLARDLQKLGRWWFSSIELRAAAKCACELGLDDYSCELHALAARFEVMAGQTGECGASLIALIERSHR